MPTGFPDMRENCASGRAMAERNLEEKVRKGGETTPLLDKPE